MEVAMGAMGEFFSGQAGAVPARPKLTLKCGSKSAAVPDVIFDDAVGPETLAVVRAMLRSAEPAAGLPRSVLIIPPAAPRTIHQQHLDNVTLLLDSWADWIRIDQPLAHGAPRKCVGAPDARIHSFEDMEIEVDKRLVGEVDTAVWELPTLQREAVMLHYDLKRATGWKANFDTLFGTAVESLYEILRKRVAC